MQSVLVVGGQERPRRPWWFRKMDLEIYFQGIPDLTVREYDGDAFLEWVEPNPILQPNISITARVAKILLASKKQPDLYQGILFIKVQLKNPNGLHVLCIKLLSIIKLLFNSFMPRNVSKMIQQISKSHYHYRYCSFMPKNTIKHKDFNHF